MVGERKLLRVGFTKFDVCYSLRSGVFTCNIQHFDEQIGSGDASMRGDYAGDSERRFSRAAGKIQNVVARRKTRTFEDKIGCGS